MEGGTLAGAEVYEQGRALFLEKACWGCHTIAGISSSSQAPELTDAGGWVPAGLSLEAIERVVMETTIARCGGSIPEAARALGVSPSTIYRKRAAWR